MGLCFSELALSLWKIKIQQRNEKWTFHVLINVSGAYKLRYKKTLKLFQIMWIKVANKRREHFVTNKVDIIKQIYERKS